MTKLSQLKIDPEFQNQINPPSFEETHQLEMNILKEERILDTDLYFIDAIGLSANLSPTRSNGLLAMVKQMRLYALAFSKK